MQVNANFDEQGYIANYAVIGTVENAIDVEVPEDFWQHNCRAYKLVDGALMLDVEREEELAAEPPEVIPDQSEDRMTILEEDIETIKQALDILLGGADDEQTA